MHSPLRSRIRRLLLPVATMAWIPSPALARESATLTMDAATGLLTLAGVVVGALLLTRVWLGIVNVSLLHHESLASIQRRKPYVPGIAAAVGTVAATLVMVLLLSRNAVLAPFQGAEGATRAAAFFGVACVLWVIAELRWRRAREYAFAFLMGSFLTVILLGFHRALLHPSSPQDPYFMALGIVCLALTWRFLFGPWPAHIKATVLGTFLGLLSVHLLWNEAPDVRMAQVIAMGIALIPAGLWCVLFLQEHRQRMSAVLLMFFGGMLSTAPILFYDLLVRRGVEFQFFLFRVIPESFSRNSSAFVSDSLTMHANVRSALMASLIAFLIVGLIEELSKVWVARKNGMGIFRSVDDVMQLCIIVAIGFAFAENVLNPSYFPAFVQHYLLDPPRPEWGSFLSNVVGRSILTSMVHILASGVFGYFLGLAIFAGPVVRDVEQQGKEYLIAYALHRLLRLPEKAVFRTQMLFTGLLLSTALHGLFNFMVSVPDLLPGNPRTLGALLGSPQGSVLHSVALLMIPSLLYVLGGFWILTVLLHRSESRKERGILVPTDTFVTETPGA